jgi:hypothetical protein
MQMTIIQNLDMSIKNFNKNENKNDKTIKKMNFKLKKIKINLKNRKNKKVLTYVGNRTIT